MTSEAQQLLDAAAAGTLDLDAEHPTLGAPADGKTPGDDNGTNADETSAATNDEGKGAPDGSDEPAGAPIASKSGTYTIPHEKLTKAREEAKTYKAEKDALAAANAELQAKVEELTALQQQNLATAQQAAAARSESGAAATVADKNLEAVAAAADQGVDLAIFGDFSEKDIAKGIATLNAQAEARVMGKLDGLVSERVAAALKPQAEKTAQAEKDAHYAAILAKHPDADEFVPSTEFKAWLENLPYKTGAAYDAALAKGTPEQVIEVFDAFKRDFKPGNPADAVQKALAATTAKPPTSLSDLPGSVGLSDAEQVDALAADPAKLMDFMNSLPADRRERVMNRVV